MAKFSHLDSTVSGHVPASLLRGQLAVNSADQAVFTLAPDGQIVQISSGKPGLASASGSLGVHIPVWLHPVAQFAPGYTEAQVGAKFTDNGTTATLQCVPLFIFGQKFYTPATLSCPSINTGVYYLIGNVLTRTISLVGQGAPLPAVSGSLNYSTGDFTLFIQSDGHIYPWFYLLEGRSSSIAGIVNIVRISPYKTFGAIPVSTGFAGAAATSYWGNP